MADNLVGAQDELYESKVSQALMFCFDNAFPRNILLLCRFRPFCFSLPMRFCVPECICYEERVKPSTAETVFFIRYPVCLSERVLVKVLAILLRSSIMKLSNQPLVPVAIMNSLSASQRIALIHNFPLAQVKGGKFLSVPIAFRNSNS